MKKEEFYKMIKQGEPSYKIIYIDDTNYPNEAYNSYWALVGVNDKFYYIEYSKDHFLYNKSDLTITLYNKISPYIKRQASYSENVDSLADILNYIHKTKNTVRKCLKDTFNQDLFIDLNSYKEKRNNKPYTIKRQLEEIAGYREEYILNNLKWIYEEEKNEKYHVLVFEDVAGNYFKINLKDRGRLIVG